MYQSNKATMTCNLEWKKCHYYTFFCSRYIDFFFFW